MQVYIPKDLVSISIDDWTKKKGMNYGSIVVNSKTGKTIVLAPVKLDDSHVYKAINELRYSKYLLYKELKIEG